MYVWMVVDVCVCKIKGLLLLTASELSLAYIKRDRRAQNESDKDGSNK
jgi:hypothetical protein